jgi:hypothetical protein
MNTLRKTPRGYPSVSFRTSTNWESLLVHFAETNSCRRCKKRRTDGSRSNPIAIS